MKNNITFSSEIFCRIKDIYYLCTPKAITLHLLPAKYKNLKI